MALHEAPNIAVGLDAETLALDLGACAGGETVAGHVYHHCYGKFGHGVGILSRGIHCHYLPCRTGLEVDIVVAGSGTDYNLQLRGCRDDVSCHLVRPDYEGIGIGHSLDQLFPGRVFLEQADFMPCFLGYFLHTGHGSGRKRFFCSDKYFHGDTIFSLTQIPACTSRGPPHFRQGRRCRLRP